MRLQSVLRRLLGNRRPASQSSSWRSLPCRVVGSPRLNGRTISSLDCGLAVELPALRTQPNARICRSVVGLFDWPGPVRGWAGSSDVWLSRGIAIFAAEVSGSCAYRLGWRLWAAKPAITEQAARDVRNCSSQLDRLWRSIRAMEEVQPPLGT